MIIRASGLSPRETGVAELFFARGKTGSGWHFDFNVN
jgi:hypothetical protein